MAYNYDINEPRYSSLYEQYWRFFNKNLDRLKNANKHIFKWHDLNNDYKRKLVNPQSYKYDEYFDN